MKCFSLSLAFLAGSIAVCAAGLSGVKTVYLMPMTGGLDQYLAAELTARGVLHVVTDPEKADVVLTDHVGRGFEEKLAELNGPKAEGNKDDKGVEFARVGVHGGVAGVSFAVDRKTHEVVWSSYEKPRGHGAVELKRTADHIAEKLARSVKGGQ